MRAESNLTHCPNFGDHLCHPTSTGPITKIGGDYPTFACAYLGRLHPGVTAAFFQGCAGDQKVDARDATGDGFRRLDIDEVRDSGESLGLDYS